MKITRGFAAVQPDGQYLYISSHQTHTGHHVDVSLVTDINDATIRTNPAARERKEAEVLRKREITWVPVEVRREVILKGFGT